jgi:PAS domain S-box-containing protein
MEDRISEMSSFLELQPQTLLQSILDSVGVALAVIDTDRRFVFTNKAALDMLGVVENVSLVDWRRDYKFHDSHGREILPLHAPAMRAFEGKEVKPHEVRMTLPDGRIKWLHVAAHPFSVLGLTGVLLIVTDETEQIELRKAMERAQHLEAIGILAGGLAHDFNNVLSAVSGNVSLALSDEGVQETTRTRLQQMAAALKRGAALVARLMQHSRAHGGQIRPVQINDVVNTALDLTRPLFKGRVKVNTELSNSLPAVPADSVRLEQVLVNLVLNSLDAMPEGGELTLGTKLVSEDKVEDGRNKGNRRLVLITVADTGIGIPEDIRHSIFDPFFTTKAKRKGVGLGLSSAQEIVREHHGRIDLQSTPGVGTTFSIYLPVS